jgi:hypothetical protein
VIDVGSSSICKIGDGDGRGVSTGRGETVGTWKRKMNDKKTDASIFFFGKFSLINEIRDYAKDYHKYGDKAFE